MGSQSGKRQGVSWRWARSWYEEVRRPSSERAMPSQSEPPMTGFAEIQC
jgi:hypothetical protein